MDLAVGKDIAALCGKCGDVWHVVVAIEGGKPAKVQCKQCGGYHRYKRPPSEPAPARAAKEKKVVAGKPRKSPPRISVPKRDEPLIQPDMSMPVRGYAMSETYKPGERIEHPKFGQGVVESFPSPGKMNVFFEDGRRTLAQGRAAM
jgi:hypothetical protein